MCSIKAALQGLHGQCLVNHLFKIPTPGRHRVSYRCAFHPLGMPFSNQFIMQSNNINKAKTIHVLHNLFPPKLYASFLLLWLITGLPLRLIGLRLKLGETWDSRTVLRSVNSQCTVSSSLSGGMVADLGYGFQGNTCKASLRIGRRGYSSELS